jgi:hypothetical protein
METRGLNAPNEHPGKRALSVEADQSSKSQVLAS